MTTNSNPQPQLRHYPTHAPGTWRNSIRLDGEQSLIGLFASEKERDAPESDDDASSEECFDGGEGGQAAVNYSGCTIWRLPLPGNVIMYWQEHGLYTIHHCIYLFILQRLLELLVISFHLAGRGGASRAFPSWWAELLGPSTVPVAGAPCGHPGHLVFLHLAKLVWWLSFSQFDVTWCDSFDRAMSSDHLVLVVGLTCRIQGCGHPLLHKDHCLACDRLGPETHQFTGNFIFWMADENPSQTGSNEERTHNLEDCSLEEHRRNTIFAGKASSTFFHPDPNESSIYYIHAFFKWCMQQSDVRVLSSRHPNVWRHWDQIESEERFLIAAMFSILDATRNRIMESSGNQVPGLGLSETKGSDLTEDFG